MSGARRARAALRCLLAAALAGAAAAGCSDLTITRPVDAITTPIANPSLSRDIQPILTATCASSDACHAGPTPQMGLSLEAGRTWTHLVNVPATLLPPLLRVEPGQPDSSALVIMLGSDSAARRGWPRMPRTSYPLPDPVIQTIRNWITNGALDN